MRNKGSNLILEKKYIKMRTTIFHCLIFIQFGSPLFSAFSTRLKETIPNIEKPNQADENHYSSSISTTKADITTPLPTIPTIQNPSTTSLNPSVSNPETTSTPMTTPLQTVPSPFSSGSSWCVASQAASPMALQIALDYACGHSGTDCSPVSPGGSCYTPITIRDHASYAFNGYYQKNPVPNSCNFGDTAFLTSTDPSYGTCQYPSTSTSSSVLDTSNLSGSRVFGSGVPNDPTPSSTVAISYSHLVLLACFMVVLAKSCL